MSLLCHTCSKGIGAIEIGNLGLEGSKQKSDGAVEDLSPAAQGYISATLTSIDEGEDAAAVSGLIASIEQDAIASGLQTEELDIVLLTAAVARSSSEFWEAEFVGSQSKAETPAECAKRIAAADAIGALYGALGGPGGAAASAARASAVAAIEALHLNLCEE